MDRSTHIGGPRGEFPLTRRSMIEAVRADDPAARERAVETLITAYWKPVYKYVRMKWRSSNEEAKDLTQGFFTSLLDRGLVERYGEGRALFRTYLRLCVDGYVANERKAARRQKRGGDARLVAIDFASAEAEFAATRPEGDDEGYFDRECLRGVFERALASLRAAFAGADKSVHLSLFTRHDLHGAKDGRPTYEQLAAEFDLPVTQVTNHLAWARRAFRRFALEALRDLAGDEGEFREEARRLFGVDA